MIEKLNKIRAQVIACMIIIIAVLGIGYRASLGGIPESAYPLINKIVDVALFGAIAWLFTASKNGDQK